ncbi:MAG: 4Fe-4S dicluster domain-containing protein [Thermodesulfobacteriota bacterium]|nr:4Fe-4S dicluster domain-containing protein [Thermodesulfobacteriota bacterium]
MEKSSEEMIATVGKNKIDITKTVRDIRGIEDLVKDAIESIWNPNLVNQVKVWLQPFAHANDIAEWDRVLLERYPPLYTNIQTRCSDCYQGPCDLSKGTGVCGIDCDTYQAKLSLLSASRGLASFVSDTREIVDYCIKRHGIEAQIKWGKSMAYGYMNSNVFAGQDLRSLADANKVLTYVEAQLAELLTSASHGHDCDIIDLESKVFHAGSMLLVAMDIAEALKFTFFGFLSAGDQELLDVKDYPQPYTQVGLGTVDKTKPVVVFVGNDFLPAYEAVQFIKENKLEDRVEVCGVGSAGHDLARFYEPTKILVTPVKLTKLLRMGIVDVLVVSDNCCKVNILEEAGKTDTRVIVTSFKQSFGLTERSFDPVDDIVKDLTEDLKAVLIFDKEKAGETAIRAAQKVKGKREDTYLLSGDRVREYASKCDGCDACFRVCPNRIISSKVILSAKNGDTSKLAELCDSSLFCGKCEVACPQDIPIMDMILASSSEKIKEDNLRIRAGRGIISQLEVRDLAITAFSLPGMVSITGCGNYPGSDKDVAWLANEFVDSNFAVTVTGCAAADAGRHFDEKTKKWLFERFPSLYNPRCIANLGGCSAHGLAITSPAYKLGYVAYKCPYKASFEMLADMMIKGASVLILWGPATELMYTMAAAHARSGIKVLVGPHGSNFKRFLAGNKHDRSKWWCLHGYENYKKEIEPLPEHLIYPVETKEEAFALACKLCFGFQDLDASRVNKFDLWLNSYKKWFGKTLPDDWHLFVKKDVDMPMTKKAKLMRLLAEEHGFEVDRKRGRITKFKHRDGRMLDPGEMVEEYGMKVGLYATLLPRLVYNVRADRGEE